MKKGFVFFTVILAFALICSSAFAQEGHEDQKRLALAYLQSAVSGKCPVRTFESDDPLISVSSYTYESAVAALALMSEGDHESASLILDAFVTGMESDVEFKDRFRNAYAAGNAKDLPGYWDNGLGQWIQDAYQIGAGTKSNAAAAAALLTAYQAKPNDAYLNTAIKAVDWVIGYCQDGEPGFTSGYNGWRNSMNYTDLTAKAVVDNIWMYRVCQLLADITGWEKYSAAASSAYDFVTEKMYSAGDSRFFQGTAADGVTPSANLVLTDVQALAALAFGNDAGMDNIERNLASDGGYSYDNSAINGSWLEGTMIAVLALKQTGETEKAENVLSAMEMFQMFTGVFPQASVSELKTGESDRTISDWPTVGATAWYILAVNGTNPFQ